MISLQKTKDLEWTVALAFGIKVDKYLFTRHSLGDEVQKVFELREPLLIKQTMKLLKE